MAKIWQFIILICVVIGVVILGCDNDDDLEIIREKPVSRVKVKNEIRGEPGTDGLIKWNEWDSVLVIPGPGTFISGGVSRNGGTHDLDDRTTVRLSLDHKDIVLKSLEVARVMGLSEQNYSGFNYFQGVDSVESIVLGYSEPLYFKEILLLAVLVDSTSDDVGDDRVKKLLVYATYTAEHTGDDEHIGGGDHEPSFP